MSAFKNDKSLHIHYQLLFFSLRFYVCAGSCRMKVVEKTSLICCREIVFILFFTLTFGVGVVNAQNHWDEHFQTILDDPPEQFVVSGLNRIGEKGNGKVAIDLGSSVGHETKLLLQKGYKVIAVDSNAKALDYMMMQTGIRQYKPKLTTINSKFESLNFTKLPQADLVVSSFALPFVSRNKFKRVWQDITANIKPGGHIIVNLFDSSFSFYNNKSNMTFHTKSEAKALFTNFKIIEFREVRNDPLKPGTKNHYYVIVAEKL